MSECAISVRDQTMKGQKDYDGVFKIYLLSTRSTGQPWVNARVFSQEQGKASQGTSIVNLAVLFGNKARVGPYARKEQLPNS